MDSSQVAGGGEECTNSSESGWTMYIGSPSRGEDDETEAQRSGDSPCVCDENLGSDDSMASDASSRPSHRREKGREDPTHFPAEKKGCHKQGVTINTRDAMRSKVEKKASTGYSHVRGGDKRQ
uniref:Uncharacterized protein n=1 Tax=Kalanchoe fedtschenkoi TaxID=63787 RepID=A0A7N0T651_KALFE